ncbi:MAG: RodZ domain-containing protein [Candidatus Omnitrophota bacterium]
MIEEICFKLKEKRKELGYSIEEVVERIKLHPSAIHDIESANLHNVSPVYMKGFIRLYASFLGVNAEEALLEISPKQNQVKENKRQGILQRNSYSKVIKTVFVSFIGIIVIWSFFSFLGLVFRKVFRHGSRRITAQSKVSKLPVVPSRELEKVVKESKDDPVFDSSLQQGEDIMVSLSTKRDVFIRVKVDGRLLFDSVLKEGAVETWQAKNEMEFAINDGSAVYIEVNGKPISPLTALRKPIKRLTINHSGIKVDK